MLTDLLSTALLEQQQNNSQYSLKPIPITSLHYPSTPPTLAVYTVLPTHLLSEHPYYTTSKPSLSPSPVVSPLARGPLPPRRRSAAGTTNNDRGHDNSSAGRGTYRPHIHPYSLRPSIHRSFHTSARSYDMSKTSCEASSVIRDLQYVTCDM